MFTKVGSLKSNDNNGPIIIENAEGKNYEVNSVLAFIWSKLDGLTSNEKISEELSRVAKIETTEAITVVNQALEALQDVDLIQVAS